MRRGARGFTLIELLFVVVLISIMLTLAAPSFVSFISSNRATTAVNDFLQGVTLTRTEALKRGRRVTLMPNDATGTPSLSGQWRYGWVVCDRLNTAAATAATGCASTANVISNRVPLNVSTVATDPAGGAAQAFTDGLTKTYISFDGTGYPRKLDGSTASGGILFTDTISTGAPQVRKLCLAILGSPRISKDTAVCSYN